MNLDKRRLFRTMALVFIIMGLLSACLSNGKKESVRETPTANPVETLSPEKTVPEVTTPTEEEAIMPATLPLNKLHQGEYFSPVLGLAEDYPKGTSTLEIEQDFELMARYGINAMRVSIAWGDYESFKGEENWYLLDSEVDLAEKYEIELYPYICYAPTWATGSDWKSPPENMQDWYDFVYRLVDRYKGRISHWELWNEGDNADFWRGNWDEQLELIKVGAKAVKDADPNATTIFGGLTDLGWFNVESIYESKAIENIDVINIHFYNETWNPSSTESIYSSVQTVGDVIRSHGGKQELWVAEIGYSDYVQEDGAVSYYYRIKESYEKTKEFQAVTFTRAFSLIASTEDVSNVLWYEIKNLRLNSAAIGDVNNYFLGALDHTYFPKHLWFAIASLKQLFSAPFKSINDEIEIVNSNAFEPYTHAFQRENGDVILVAWNRGNQKETIDVAIPGKFDSAIRYSVTGEKSAFKFKQADEAATLSLTLEPDNVNIIELFAGNQPARLTISKPSVAKTGKDMYTVSATVTNIGKEKAADLTGEIFMTIPLDPIGEPIIPIEALSPGEKIKLTWKVKHRDPTSDVPLQVWLAVNPKDSAAAAILVDLK